MLSRITAITLVVALPVLVMPTPVFAQAPAAGSIAGVTYDAGGQGIATGMRVRNVVTGQVSGIATSAANGGFTFAGLLPGQYVVEAVNAGGQVLGTSSAVVLNAAAQSASGVIVRLAGARKAGGAFFGSPLGITTLAAVGGGIAGATVALTRPRASSVR